MAQLSYNLRELPCPDGKSATMVELNGSVDPATIDAFDAIFDELIEGGNIRIVMDLAKLKYINSTGMGMMVQYYDQLADEGGGLVLMTVQAKIILVLEMLGLQELFPIVATEEEAISALMGEAVAPASVEVKLEDSAAHAHSSSVTAAGAGGHNACGSCGADLLIGGPGTYVCPRCRSVINVDASGKTRTTSQDASGTVELVIPAEAAFFKSAAAMMARIGMKCGLGDAAAMGCAGAIQNVLGNIVESAGDCGGRLQLAAGTVDGSFEVKVFCMGKQLGSDSLLPSKGLFDELECSPVPGGSLVSLSKKVG